MPSTMPSIIQNISHHLHLSWIVEKRETLSVQENDSCDHFVLITQNKQFVAV